jgi:hypothetical protein
MRSYHYAPRQLEITTKFYGHFSKDQPERSRSVPTYLGHSSLSASVTLYDITIVGGTFTQTYKPSEIATLFQPLAKLSAQRRLLPPTALKCQLKLPAVRYSRFRHTSIIRCDLSCLSNKQCLLLLVRINSKHSCQCQL